MASEAARGSVTTYPITEYPVALSDDELTDTNLEQVLDKWENVIRVNHNNNAPAVLLIHTALPGPRLAAEQGILQRVADLTDLWIGDMKTFAQSWEAQGVTCERWPSGLAAMKWARDRFSQGSDSYDGPKDEAIALPYGRVPHRTPAEDE